MSLSIKGGFKPWTGAVKAGDLSETQSGSSDPHFSNVSLLIQANGNVGTSAFADSSQTNLPLSVVGTPVISDTQSKFNGKSIYFDGSSAIIGELTAANHFPAGQDYTIEFWLYRIGGDYASGIGDYGGTSGFMAFSDGSSTYYAQHFAPGGSASRYWSIFDSSPTNTWTHFALVNQGDVKSAYRDGTLVGTASYNVAGPLANGTNFIYVGCGDYYYTNNTSTPNPHYYTTGYIDQYRITNGVARYTENSTPPTEAF